jgi:hypothetical protein
MVKYAISLRVITITALTCAFVIFTAVASPALSKKIEDPTSKAATVMKIELPTLSTKTFFATITGLGIETIDGRKVGMAKIRVSPLQDVPEGTAFCILDDAKIQGVFEAVYQKGVSIRCFGTPVAAPEGTVYSSHGLYLIESARTW